MNNYCIPLDLDLQIFNSNLHPVEFIKLLPAWSDAQFTTPRGNKHIRIPKDVLHQDFINFFNNRGIHLIGVEVFYTVPKGSNIIHSDVNPLGDVAKINWVYGGDNSVMEWYVPDQNYLTDNTPNRTAPTIANSPTLRFLKEEVDLVHSQSIKSPSIVQAGCPHNMLNGQTSERICISTIFESIDLGQRLTIAQAKNVFKDLLIGTPGGS